MYTQGSFVAPYEADYVLLAKANALASDTGVAVDDEHMADVMIAQDVVSDLGTALYANDMMADERTRPWSVIATPFYFEDEVFVLVAYNFETWG